MSTYVKSTSRWSWLRVLIDGKDLVVRGARATCFGSDDPLDNGKGTAGWPVDQRQDVPVVALPYRVKGHWQFKDSPIPAVRVKTPRDAGQKVRLWNPVTNKSCIAEVADLGPSLIYKGKYIKTAIDLNRAACELLGIKYDPNKGSAKIDFRIIDAEQLLTDDQRP